MHLLPAPRTANRTSTCKTRKEDNTLRIRCRDMHGSSLKRALTGNVTLRWKLRTIISVVILAIAFAALLYVWMGRSGVVGPAPGVESDRVKTCSDDASKEYLKELCKSYADGLIAGELCESLCVLEEIHFQKCLDHGRKLHVLLAEWREIPMILKTPKPLGHKLEQRILPGQVQTREEFINQANRSIYQSVANWNYHRKTEVLLKGVFSSCDANRDNKLHYDEAMVCWQLLQTQEYVMFSLLEDLADIPDVYGSCGLLYGIEFVDPKPILGINTAEFDTRPWNIRANLALALLVMIQTFEQTPYGTLHVCGLNEHNLGVTKRNGQLITKVINIDKSWFGDSKQSEDDSDLCVGSKCTMVRCAQEQVDRRACCLSTCGTPRCNGQHYLGATNNLQSLCYMIFRQYASRQPALLFNPPESIRSELERILDQCINPRRRLMHIPSDVMDSLHRLLRLTVV